MFDKFTERARKVMSLARQEAQKSNSEFIGTEHILIGIMAEGDGHAVKFLKACGVTAKDVYHEVGKLITPSTSPLVTLGQLPFSPRTKHVLVLAEKAAEGEAINSEHLLLGLMREGEGIAAQVLTALDVREGDFTARKSGYKWTYKENAKDIGEWLSNVKSANVSSIRLTHELHDELASLPVGEIQKKLKKSVGAFLSSDGSSLFVKFDHEFGRIVVELKK